MALDNSVSVTFSQPPGITTGPKSVLNIKLTRPSLHNALDESTTRSLINTFSTIPHHVRSVVLSAEGSSFCSGADLKWMAADIKENSTPGVLLTALYRAMMATKVPVISRVTGLAYGGGAGLVAASGISLALKSANFGFPEVRHFLHQFLLF